MSVTTDQALRSALTDVVAGQPAAPHDRIDSVRRRHVRRRQSQLAALGTAAVVAVAGATLGVLSVRSGGDDGTQFAKRNVPSWALQWPDARDPSIPQKVLDGAVDAWSHAAGGIVIDYADSAAPIPDAQQVIWYRAAKVANASKIAVMFEVSSVYGHQLVVGYASSDEVIDGQPGYDVTNAETPRHAPDSKRSPCDAEWHRSPAWREALPIYGHQHLHGSKRRNTRKLRRLVISRRHSSAFSSAARSGASFLGLPELLRVGWVVRLVQLR